ncbi:hypothetical protein JMA_32580 [Jeotgalibacillus malaysiensis]|uniref:Uncharacterized protein n=1 Tax=Jeotgalibacillus malaysiensis TaxID=1508404 RepID=A0A0B5AQM7_9BACL|nr:hypothetical protein [Jeotgalibacillus malaysiensis]AJD92575.1 hypothetical protein JMA_32580 [Jeotgalibacillus malaysiensis]
MRKLLFYILISCLLLAGCSEGDTASEHVTMEQLMINEGIEYEELLVSAPYDSEYGFAIYTTEDGIGNAQFSTVDGQWHYTGSTAFSSENTGNSPLISFGMTYWEMSSVSVSDRQPVVIIAGEITAEVSRVEVEFDEEVKDGKLVSGAERNIWYWVGGYQNLDHFEVRAYDQDDQVIATKRRPD